MFPLSFLTLFYFKTQDIWRTFRKTRNPRYPSDSQKFYKYLFHGFGVPIIITIMLAVIDETNWFPMKWRPQIGKFECFLRNDRNIEFYYLYLPMSLILLVNIVLYSITAYKIYTVQNDKFILSGKIERRRVVSCNPIRMRFLLYLRLFLLMGNYIFFKSIITSIAMVHRGLDSKNLHR
jgi:G protein-coupled receptor Mth (Methuselah protein)